MCRIEPDAVTHAVRRWCQNTGAFTGSGRPDIGDILNDGNRPISNTARAIRTAIVEAIEEAGARAAWCDCLPEVGVQALSDALERGSLPETLPPQLARLTELVGGNDVYRETFTPFIEEARSLLTPESDSHGRLLRELCLEHRIR